MAGPGRSTGPEPQVPPPADASASAGSSPASAAWNDLRESVGGDEVVGAEEVEGAELADPELIAEAERIADEALAEARAKEAEGQARQGEGPPGQAPPGQPPMDADEAVVEAERALLDDLTTLAAERDDYLDQLRRVTADFDNYRKRIAKQQTEHLERAAEGLVEKLLAVLDVFDAALAHGEGFDQVHAALVGLLEKEGLERIDPLDRPFDPNEADAVAHEEADEGPIVSEVLRAGYRWKGRVLRPAMVKVRG